MKRNAKSRKRLRMGLSNGTLIVFMTVLMLFVGTRAWAASLNQKNIRLTSEVRELVSTNQWIKYQISDKISLDKLEVYARDALQMQPLNNAAVQYLSVDMAKINQKAIVAAESTWVDRLQQSVGDIFDGN